MGLLGLLFGGMVAGSAVKCAAEDSYFKQQYSTFPNGVKFWIDRKGTARLMDGTIIVNPAGDVVEDIHGRVIYNRLAGLKEKEIEEEKEVAKKYNKLVWCRRKNLTQYEAVEFSTGKVVESVCVDRKNNKFAKKYKDDSTWHMLSSCEEAYRYRDWRNCVYWSDFDEIGRKYPYCRETEWWNNPAR